LYSDEINVNFLGFEQYFLQAVDCLLKIKFAFCFI
jgi:hypothetical protein